MRSRRDDIFLATKVNRGSRDGVFAEVQASLVRLETDRVDLVQVHTVNAWADLEQVLAPDGALAGLHEARNQGLVRFIGITGHARPEILGHALEEYDFDTVLVALGMADRLVSSPETFVLPRATQRNIGVIAMKVFGHGTIEHRGLALHYSLGLPGVSLAIVGMDNVEQIDENLELAANIRALNEREEQQLVAEVRPLVEKDAEDSQQGESDLLWLHDTKVMGWLEQDEPVLARY